MSKLQEKLRATELLIYYFTNFQLITAVFLDNHMDENDFYWG